MNILITLPPNLVEKIISGEKKYEMRKCVPEHLRLGVDGFYVVEKGPDNVRCWCRVDYNLKVYPDSLMVKKYASRIGVSEAYMNRYANGKKVYLWHIDKVISFSNLKRDSLYVRRNPQQFAYCPISYGESF